MENMYGNNDYDRYGTASGNAGQPPQAPYAGGYPMDERKPDPVGVGEWVGAIFLMMIPIVNIVLCFVWAFGKKTKKSKSNYFKAYLIVAAIELAAAIIILIIYFAAILAMIS